MLRVAAVLPDIPNIEVVLDAQGALNDLAAATQATDSSAGPEGT
jgi:hypothetical protein